MQKIKRQDIVAVIKGKDKGKSGKVLNIFGEKNTAIVEGVNMVKKHMRRRSQEQQGGIVNIELPIQLSNLLLFCKRCNRGVRVGFSVLKDGTKTRICKVCKEAI
ncbi:MAG: 50S ribosomal protein L24 [Candidatus Omnitrophica bacterium]|nr:50S ribosomal protein L24 [Candidatus Omnitrophota bacterium]MDD5610861.1 50S ribosomal protein L24 [Candidatus Omnitrophota bacterium]